MAQKAYAVKFSGRVDREKRVIYGVSVMTEGTAKGHGSIADRITLNQVSAAAAEYASGVKVVDRHTRPTHGLMESTVGVLKNFSIDGNQLRADLHLLDSEKNGDKLLEMAEKMPDTFGISVALGGPDEVVGGVTYIRCNEIYNAALVDVPAANPTGLFSAIEETDAVDATNNATMKPEEIVAECQKQVTAAFGEYGSRLAKIETALGALKPASQEEFSALKNEVKELSGKLDSAKTELTAKVADRSAIAQDIAKEFAKHTGTNTGVTNDNSAAAAAATSKSDALNASVQKHYAATKSKAEAVKLAVAENKEFGALLQGGHQIKWA